MVSWKPTPGSFVDRTVRRPDFFESDALVFEGEKLGPQQLDVMAIHFIEKCIGSGLELEPTFLAYALAMNILVFFLGNEWVNAKVFGSSSVNGETSRQGDAAFLSGNYFDTFEKMIQHRMRITKLAQCLFSFQDIPGIKHRIRQMKTESVEAALGEVDCAVRIAAPIYKLRFIAPTGRKGADYDCEFTTSWGRIICGEIKTKEETTPLSQSTVWNTLESARKQLPKGSPGVVFLRIPLSWTTQKDHMITIRSAIGKVFRQSSRLVAIVIVHETWLPLGGGYSIFLSSVTAFNDRSPFYATDIERALRSVDMREVKVIRFARGIAIRLSGYVEFIRSLLPYRSDNR